ncbi:MAG TPA: hypothetical protein PKA02_04480, partial [Candidatus Saccharibacteria bacterium]|nr:hypothetical protein [Candidatus Saccharibacteria bacterium]
MAQRPKRTKSISLLFVRTYKGGKSVRRLSIFPLHSKTNSKSSRAASKTKHLAKRSAQHVKRASVVVHRNIAKRPHQYAFEHWGWYRKWHKWKWHKATHYTVLSGYLLMIGVVLFSSFRSALAADLTNTWDFSSPSAYNFDSGVEASGAVARLKAQNYANDVNTMALYHADDGSGSSLSDSSSNSNPATLTNTTWGTGKLGGSLQMNGTTSSAQAADSASLSLTQSNSIEAWVKFNSSFAAASTSGRQTVADKGPYKLYFDDQTGKAVYELQNSTATTWQQQAGSGVNGSWDLDGKNSADASVGIGTDLYVGTGNSTAGDAEVWKQSAAGVWTQIGG